MALDETAKEENVNMSIRKYFVDNLYTNEGIELVFDRTVNVPNIGETSPPSVNEWIVIIIGDISMSDLSYLNVPMILCTRQDTEGNRLSRLRDIVMGYLTDTSQTDTMRRITLYKADDWTNVGALLVHNVVEGEHLDAPDQSKYKILNAIIRWASKI